jgi:hypothetical protein
MHNLWTRYAKTKLDIPTTIHRGFVDFTPFDIKIHISTILITITPNY